MESAVTTERAQDLRRAAVRATLAPSVHNTQPWRFVIAPNSLEVYADAGRQLRALDPTGRQLLISCGCAIFNARAALAGRGRETVVERWPDRARSDLIARLSLTGRRSGGGALADLDAVIDARRTNRRQFADEEVDADTVDAFRGAAGVEGAVLVPLLRHEHRLAAAALSQQADREQNADAAYRAEIRVWTSDDHRRRDGVQSLAVPHVDGSAHDDLPIRDFDSIGTGRLPAETRSSVKQCLLLLCMAEDTPEAWVRAGEALERVLLEATRRGLAASPLTQVLEVTRTREALRRELDLGVYPDALLRVGNAPATAASRRRRMVDVVSDRDSELIF